MTLESLAPDQRAVIQLVLRQGRSYADLANLLGIPEDAVRQRARAGLGVLGADASVSAADQGRIGDFLLGQQDESERAATLELLETSPVALDWAEFVSEDLLPVARHGLPALPAAGAASVAAEPAPVDAGSAPAEAEPEPVDTEPEPGGTRGTRRERPSRRRQRSLRERETAPAASEPTPKRESSRLGGALLLAALALLVVVGVVYLFNRSDDEPTATNTTSTEAGAGASATPQPIAQLPLRAAGGGNAEGLVQINASQQGQVGFTLVARNVPATRRGRSAYAIWLVGRGKPAVRLGFGEVLDNQGGTLAVQGPEEKLDPAVFTRGLTTYSQMIVSRETSSEVAEPSRAILRGSLASLRGD